MIDIISSFWKLGNFLCILFLAFFCFRRAFSCYFGQETVNIDLLSLLFIFLVVSGLTFIRVYCCLFFPFILLYYCLYQRKVVILLSVHFTLSVACFNLFLGVLRKYGYDVWRVEQWYLVQKMRRKQKKGCQVLTHHYQLPTYSAQRRVQLQSIGSLFQILGHSINLLVFA